MILPYLRLKNVESPHKTVYISMAVALLCVTAQKNIQHQPRDQIRNLSLDSGDAAHSVFFAIFHAMVRLWLRFR